jgi:hypothetical protein
MPSIGITGIFTTDKNPTVYTFHIPQQGGRRWMCHNAPRAVFLNRRAAARKRALASNYTGLREVLMEFVILVF